MGSAGSARPEVVIERESSESSDPDFEPGTHTRTRSFTSFRLYGVLASIVGVSESQSHGLTLRGYDRERATGCGRHSAYESAV